MTEQMLNGDWALAYGALVAGVKVVSSYPGSPSTGTVQALLDLAPQHDLYVEWSTNEKVAMEMGIGASIAGRRALVCTKSVGMNLMLDPMMALNLTPVHGGLVILLGDDPGGYGSQNDQDTRPLAVMLEMPMLEPATPAEGYAMMVEAFEVSERLQTPIIIRETRTFTQQEAVVAVPDGPYHQPSRGVARETLRFVPYPGNVVEKHRELHQERLPAITRWIEETPYNRIEGHGARGIVAVGFAYSKLLDVMGPALDGVRLLKLSALYPLPEQVLNRFFDGLDQALVLEENEPYVETHIKAVALDHGHAVRVLGKLSDHVHREGELFRWQIQQALEKFLPAFTPAQGYTAEGEGDERPERENYCKDCRYDVILDALYDVAAELGQRPVLVGDPGCLASVAERLDAKYAIGSAVGVADGISKAGCPERAVALFGDSSFFHTTLPSICNAIYNQSDILLVVLDNGSTVTSGNQPNPGVGKDALGRTAPILDIETIARACGIGFVHGIGPDGVDDLLHDAFRAGLTHRGLALLVIRKPCEG